MSGISAIYILDHKKRVLISRNYRGDVPNNVQDSFNKKMIEFDEVNDKPIIMDSNGNVFFYKRVENLYFLLVTRRNSNATLVFTFLYRLIDVFTEYFKVIEEESVKDNFVVIYELLDEMMDNGYPQYTEVKLLSEFIKCEKHQMIRNRVNESEVKLPQAMTTSVYWRKEGIVYPKNECYLDVVEKVNMTVNATGTVIKSEILGCVKLRCFLTGMPELKLGLNDKAMYEIQGKKSHKRSVELNDLKFHQCVRLNKFDNEREISFIPPDGEFELISYRIESVAKPLFIVEVMIEQMTASKIDFTVKAHSNFKAKCIANGVKILIPIPADSQTPKFKPSIGTATYASEKDCIQWTIPQFPGHKDYSLFANCSLPSLESSDRHNFARLPVSVEFEIPYFTVSGIQVKYLKVHEKSGYQAYPWVRYLSKNGEYHSRMNIAPQS